MEETTMTENTQVELQNRYKSPVFWSGVATQILSLLMLTGVIDLSQSNMINGIVVALCEIWTLFSQRNSPELKSW